MSKNKNQEKFLGVFELGLHRVKLYAVPGQGGRFSILPPDDTVPAIRVGIDNGWPRVLEHLNHEALEFSYTSMDCRYVPSVDVSKDSSGYLFVCNHTQFSEIVARASEFVAHGVSSLYEHWEKLHETTETEEVSYECEEE